MIAPWSRPRRIGVALAGAVALVFIAANVHLIYWSFASRPDCVAHLKSSGEASPDVGAYIAASSSC